MKFYKRQTNQSFLPYFTNVSSKILQFDGYSWNENYTIKSHRLFSKTKEIIEVRVLWGNHSILFIINTIKGFKISMIKLINSKIYGCICIVLIE